jgi:hypothetical protein
MKNVDMAHVAQVKELYNWNQWCTDTAYLRAARKRIDPSISPGLVYNTIYSLRKMNSEWERGDSKLYVTHKKTGEKMKLNQRFLVRSHDEHVLCDSLRQHDPAIHEAKVKVLSTDVKTNGDGTLSITLSCKLS